MAKKDYFKEYENGKANFYLKYKSKYDKQIEIAGEGDKGKRFVHYEFQRNEINKSWTDLQTKLGNYTTLITDSEEDCLRNKLNTPSTSFNRRVQLIPIDKRDNVVTLLSEYHGLILMNHYWYGQTEVYRDNIEPSGYESMEIVSPVFWKMKNETEFVQLIYALSEAKYLDNESGEITKLVQQVASVFNFKLGKNWQSNFSKSINDRNHKYEAKIFTNLKDSFHAYRERQINKKKKI
jgi:hypothetical protein